MLKCQCAIMRGGSSKTLLKCVAAFLPGRLRLVAAEQKTAAKKEHTQNTPGFCTPGKMNF